MFQTAIRTEMKNNACHSRKFSRRYIPRTEFKQLNDEVLQKDPKLMDYLIKRSDSKRSLINRNKQIAKKIRLDKALKNIDSPFNIERSFPAIKEKKLNFKKLVGDIKELKNLNILDNNFEYNCKAEILMKNKKDIANLFEKSNILNEEILNYLATQFGANSTQKFINSLTSNYSEESKIKFEYENEICSLYKDRDSSLRNPNLVLKLKNKNVLLKYAPDFNNITMVNLNTFDSASFETEPDNNKLKLIEFYGKINTKNDEDILIQENQDNISINYKNIFFDFKPKTKEKSIRLLDGIFIKKAPSENSMIIAENIDKNTSLIHKLSITDDKNYSITSKTVLPEENFDSLTEKEKLFNYPRESVFNPLNNSFYSTFNPNIDKILNNYSDEKIIYIFLNYDDIKDIDKSLENTLYKEDVIIDFLLDGNQEIERINSVNVKGKALSKVNDLKSVLKEYEMLGESKTLDSTIEQLVNNISNMYLPSELNYFDISEEDKEKITEKSKERVEQIIANHPMYNDDLIWQQILSEYLNAENTRIIANDLVYLQKLEALETLNKLILNKEDDIYDLESGSGVRYEKNGSYITCYDSDNNLSFEMRTEGNKEVYKIYHKGLETLSEKIEIENNKGTKEYKADFYDRKGDLIKSLDINNILFDLHNKYNVCKTLGLNDIEFYKLLINQQEKLKIIKDNAYSNISL